MGAIWSSDIKVWKYNFFVSKYQFCHARQPCKGIFEICFVFSYFFVRASNCSHYSNFGNRCPKLGTGTPEDMLFTNLAGATWSLEIGIGLLGIVLLFHKAKTLKVWLFRCILGNFRECFSGLSPHISCYGVSDERFWCPPPLLTKKLFSSTTNTATRGR